jgi:hypothetical protein
MHGESAEDSASVRNRSRWIASAMVSESAGSTPCPVPSSASSRAAGIYRAGASPCSSGNSGSSLPWMTNVGKAIVDSGARRQGQPTSDAVSTINCPNRAFQHRTLGRVQLAATTPSTRLRCALDPADRATDTPFALTPRPRRDGRGYLRRSASERCRSPSTQLGPGARPEKPQRRSRPLRGGETLIGTPAAAMTNCCCGSMLIQAIRCRRSGGRGCRRASSGPGRRW